MAIKSPLHNPLPLSLHSIHLVLFHTLEDSITTPLAEDSLFLFVRISCRSCFITSGTNLRGPRQVGFVAGKVNLRTETLGTR